MRLNISYKVKEAILTRSEEIQENYIHLSTLMDQQGMSSFFKLARNRIIDMKVSKGFIRRHIVFDFPNNDIWLDIEAVKYYKDILLGYVQEEDFNAMIHCMEYDNKIRDLQNRDIRRIRMMSDFELIKEIYKCRKKKDQEALTVYKQCTLECLSRISVVKLYLAVMKLKTNISTRNKAYQIIKNVTA